MNCELILKRCLIGLQKGVNKGSKGHLLETKRAWIESQFMLFLFFRLDFYLQYGGGEREKWNMILGKEASVNGVVLTPLTPFNSLTP